MKTTLLAVTLLIIVISSCRKDPRPQTEPEGSHLLKKYTSTRDDGFSSRINTFFYDTENRLIKRFGEFDHSYNYTYDVSGNLVNVESLGYGNTARMNFEIKYVGVKPVSVVRKNFRPDGAHQLDTSYYTVNNLNQVTYIDKGKWHEQKFEYDPNGNVSHITYGDEAITLTYEKAKGPLSNANKIPLIDVIDFHSDSSPHIFFFTNNSLIKYVRTRHNQPFELFERTYKYNTNNYPVSSVTKFTGSYRNRSYNSVEEYVYE